MDYVVVGGWAAVTYGVDRATFDLDIVVADSDQNAEALASALKVLEARRDLGAGVTEELDLSEPTSLFATPVRVQTAAGPLDVMTRVQGVDSYENLRGDARRASFGDGTEFVIASKPVLERIKEAISAEEDPVRGDRDRRDLDELRNKPDPDLPPAPPR